MIPNQQSAEKLEKSVKRKLENNVYNHLLKAISKYNLEFCFLLCVIDISSRFAWLFQLKDIKCIAITNAFQKCLHCTKNEAFH